jgi:superfamily II DNA helicase RecQ
MGWGAVLMILGVTQTWFVSPLFTLRQDRIARLARRNRAAVAANGRFTYENESDDIEDDDSFDAPVRAVV